MNPFYIHCRNAGFTLKGCFKNILELLKNNLIKVDKHREINLCIYSRETGFIQRAK